MFLRLSVSHSVHRGGGGEGVGGVGYLSIHCMWYPNMPSRGSAPGGSTSRGVCSRGRGVCSQGGCLVLEGAAYRAPPQWQKTTVAGGTHPTGMHSCLNYRLHDVYRRTKEILQRTGILIV